MCDIVYCHFQQDGIATLWAGLMAMVVGIAAVVGAVLVGLRQAAIQRGQLELQSLTLKADLFDRRVEVYDVVQRWLGYFDFNHKIPGYAVGDDVPSDREREIDQAFWKAINRAQFLFQPEVHAELLTIKEHGRQWRKAMREMNRLKGQPSPELTAAISMRTT